MENKILEWKKNIIQNIILKDKKELLTIKKYLFENISGEMFQEIVPHFVASILQNIATPGFLSPEEIDTLIEKTNFNQKGTKGWSVIMMVFLYLNMQTIFTENQIDKILKKIDWTTENNLQQTPLMIYFLNKDCYLLNKYIREILPKINIEKKDYQGKNFLFYACIKYDNIDDEDWLYLLKKIKEDEISNFALEIVKNQKNFYFLEKMLHLKININHKNRLTNYLLLNPIQQNQELLERLILQKKIHLNFNLKNMIKKFDEPLWKKVEIMKLQEKLSKKLNTISVKTKNYKL